jgi:hypothetical protein
MKSLLFRSEEKREGLSIQTRKSAVLKQTLHHYTSRKTIM